MNKAILLFVLAILVSSQITDAFQLKLMKAARRRRRWGDWNQMMKQLHEIAVDEASEDMDN
uniref:Uncharacterized protein n=1 Tax=Ciona savignyi TaxID=51511 RepID=H2YNL8_CIOSA